MIVVNLPVPQEVGNLRTTGRTSASQRALFSIKLDLILHKNNLYYCSFLSFLVELGVDERLTINPLKPNGNYMYQLL
jgi:hypothetical protein